MNEKCYEALLPKYLYFIISNRIDIIGPMYSTIDCLFIVDKNFVLISNEIIAIASIDNSLQSEMGS